MKKSIIAAICLFPINAYSFDTFVPYKYQQAPLPKIVKQTQVKKQSVKDIMQIAMRYNGYDSRYNRGELTDLLNIDPYKIPWCAGFVNFVLKTAGYESTNDLTAGSYSNFGKQVVEPEPGDIVLLADKGGNIYHVAFFYGWQFDNGKVYVQLLGGNQSHSVKISSYPVASVAEYRRPVSKLS